MTKTHGYLDMELLRFTTAGSVDDGKSTLIGRLLYDSKSIFEDQMEAVEAASKRTGGSEVNLALLTDGLRAEREQGITIDVAYRYFATPKRKFIIADTPGHIQYTRNMVTGASTADLAIILIDARNGILEQTLRHSYIASLLGIPHIAVCVNKMDLVDYSESVFNDIVEKYRKIMGTLGLENVEFAAISAKMGDNVVLRSDNMMWYNGKTLLEILESTPIAHKLVSDEFRHPVQWVVRPIGDEKHHDFRGYAGRIASGVVKVGDAITVLPSGVSSTIKEIFEATESLNEANAPLSVTLTLNDNIDASRGDMIVHSASETMPRVTNEVEAMICWLNAKAMQVGGKYIVRHTTAEVRGIVKSIDFKVNINTLEQVEGGASLAMNDIAKITLKTARPIVVDSYKKNRITGSLVLIDEATNETIGAAMIL
ncbi:MAG: GTP-binding protein [Rikenellaceae bacterium]